VDWQRHAIWWHVYPLGFVGDHGGLERLVPWLDHLLALGANGLALGPVFASETHGYDTVDHRRIDPRLGGDDQFDTLVTAARERGVHVLLDGVFNHVGRGHWAFQDVLRNGSSSPYADWFRLRWTGGAEPDYDDFEGHHDLVALNHDNPAVADHVAEVMEQWLGRGVAGFRLDVAYAIPPAFWARVADRVRAAHPGAYLMGEVIHGDYTAFVTEGHLDSVTQYELWKAIWSSLNDGNFYELAHALGRHDELVGHFAPWTFLGNHDVTRIASRLTDERHLAHAVVVLATVGGTPAVYAGDEHAFRGVKYDRAGGDDEVRPPFPDTPAELSPAGLPTFHLHQELLSLRRRHPWLHRSRTTVHHVANETLVYEQTDGEHRLLVALSTAGDPVSVPVPGAREVLAGPADLLSSSHCRLSPAGWAVLAV
jgi:cyclomaltodextrinase